MTKYDYPEHNANNVWAALELAEALRESGEYDLFRGQCHTFPIQPSIFRSGTDVHEAQSALNQFAAWMHSTPDLSSLHENGTAILAVAQHYGIATPLLDFSRSPRVAAFFATDGAVRGDTGTIICLNQARFTESWSDINRRHAVDKGFPLTELIEIDVRNLWRLQAQAGVFLRCHVAPAFLEMFSCFLHIYFPQQSDTALDSTESIYPSQKSHLEMLLDQYFLVSSYDERNARLKELFGHGFTVTEESVARDMREYFKDRQIPRDHESWHTAAATRWMQEPDERYRDHDLVVEARIRLPTQRTTGEFEVALINQVDPILMAAELPTGRASIRWTVANEDDEELYVDGDGITIDREGDSTKFSVADMISAIYSGMRYLPYERAQISRTLVRYLTMITFDVYEVIDDCAGVEFAGGGVRGRGFASRERILHSLRDDILDLIDPSKRTSMGEMDFSKLMFASRYAKSCYVFERFVDLLVEDLIPSQAAVAVEGLVIGVNPMRIEIIGES
jgi:hypothetical protein